MNGEQSKEIVENRGKTGGKTNEVKKEKYIWKQGKMERKKTGRKEDVRNEGKLRKGKEKRRENRRKRRR